MFSVMVDIIFVRSVIYDARIAKVIRSLSKKYSAIFVAWNREALDNNLKTEILSKTFHPALHLRFRILNLKAPHARHSHILYLPMVIYFPLFWSWVLYNLVIYRPKVVHAFDLDTVLPCYIYKILFRKKLVFDIVDRYAMSFIPKNFRVLYSSVNWLEELFSKKSDVLMTLSEKVLHSFRKKPRETEVVLNCPEDYFSKREMRQDCFLILGYSGAINKGRGLEQLGDAIAGLEKVKLYLYGPIVDHNLFEKINRLPNVEYKGNLRFYDDYHEAIINTDVIIAIYTEETPSHQITMHNKTLEAMMGGIPIITNLSPELVNDLGFGITVKYGDIEQIKSAITRIRDDPELRKKLGSNGRKAYLEKYNWGIMERKLYNVYEKLM